MLLSHRHCWQDGAAALHEIADQVEAEGDSPLGSVVGIDGPQGAFAVWWLSRSLQNVAAERTRRGAGSEQDRPRPKAGRRRQSKQGPRRLVP